MILCGIASTGHAEFNKKKPVLCSLGDLKECSATGCDPVAADEINQLHDIERTIKKSLERILVDDFEPAGTYEVDWNGADFAGRTVNSGMYFYQLQSSDQMLRKKMLLIK